MVAFHGNGEDTSGHTRAHNGASSRQDLDAPKRKNGLLKFRLLDVHRFETQVLYRDFFEDDRIWALGLRAYSGAGRG